jgi:NADPH:quinone reductase-like Zn-dependent oxidoreductase
LLSLLGSQSLLSLSADVRAGDLDVLRELIESGKVTPVVDRTYRLADAPDAVGYVHDGRARGKVAVSVAGD